MAASSECLKASIVAWSGRGIPCGGIRPARSLTMTFSHSRAWDERFVRSRLLSTRFPVLSLSLWHETQYLSMNALDGVAEVDDAGIAAEDCALGGAAARMVMEVDAATMNAASSTRPHCFLILTSGTPLRKLG